VIGVGVDFGIAFLTSGDWILGGSGERDGRVVDNRTVMRKCENKNSEKQ
jgi:hypothetical protein